MSRIVLIGLGDLGRRLALALVAVDAVGELVVAGRGAGGIGDLAAACGPARVRAEELDVLDGDAVTALLVRERPTLILQCAALLSPWALSGRDDARAAALRAAGFAIQLPAQLPAIATVMRAVRAAGCAAPVVNCSYPDVTHPILARLGLAPTIGIGNAGMIQGLVRAALLRRGAPAGPVRVLAHHGHVTAVVTADPARCGDAPRPRIFVGDDATPADELAWLGPALPSDRALNALSAAHAIAIVRALLPGGAALATSAPGPHGLPGGYPVRIAAGEVELDLPAGVALGDAVALQERSAALDGLDAIAADGTATFTAAAQARLSAIAPDLVDLAAPLHPDEAAARCARLRAVLGLAP